MPELPKSLVGVLAVALLRNFAAADGTEPLCLWDRPQVGMVRDTIYIDGGDPGYASTTNLPDYGNDMPVFTLNLTHPFQISNSSNTTALFDTIYKEGSNIAPQVKNGHFLSNDYEFILYGGFMGETQDPKRDQVPGDDWALDRDLFQVPGQGTVDVNWRSLKLSSGTTRNVGSGAYVSVPSENLAFVFMGSRNSDWNPIRSTSHLANQSANALSDQLITVDLSEMGLEKWTNSTIGNHITQRSAAEIVWIPAGKKGTLVAIGGSRMNQSETDSGDLLSDSQVKSFQTEGQALVSTISLYDVDGQKWYTQNTTGTAPGPMAFFCAVAASSQDGNSHDIYVYGGLTGTRTLIDIKEKATDDVWVLSIPSFKWTKVYSGDSQSARYGHRCQKISDHQMMVVGGAVPNLGSAGCLSPADSFLRVFDFNTLEFANIYDPSSTDSKYEVPSPVVSAIGGGQTGGATFTASSMASGLSSLLSTKYAGTVKNYWPFPSVATASPSSSSSPAPAASSSSSGGGGSSLPSYVPPLLGVILGLLVVISVLVGVLLLLRRRRQKIKRLQSDSAASTTRRGNRRTWSWIMNTYRDEKAGSRERFDPEEATPAATDRSDYFDGSTATYVPTPMFEQKNPIESDNQEIHEMPGTTGGHELPVKRVTYADQITENQVQEMAGDEPPMPPVPSSPSTAAEPTNQNQSDPISPMTATGNSPPLHSPPNSPWR